MSNIFRKLKYIREDKRYLLKAILTRLSRLFGDETFVRLKYRLIFGRSIDLDNPQTFNEKLNWLKLNYHNPIMTVMADKYWVKQWVASKIGWDYVVPCYGHWKRLEDIDFTSLPEKCFLKSSQDSSGGMLFDKSVGGGKFKIIKKTILVEVN